MATRFRIAALALLIAGCDLFTEPERSDSAVVLKVVRFETVGLTGGILRLDALQTVAHFEYYPPPVASPWVYVTSSRGEWVRVPLARAQCDDRKATIRFTYCALLRVTLENIADSLIVAQRIAGIGADVRWAPDTADGAPFFEVTLLDARDADSLRARIANVDGVASVASISTAEACAFCTFETFDFPRTEATSVRIGTLPINWHDNILQVASGDTIRARHGATRFPGVDLVFVVP
jgi:hypothetical protein